MITQDLAADSNAQGLKKSDRPQEDPDFQPSAEDIRNAFADNLQQKSGASFAYSQVAASISPNIDPEAFVEYRTRFLTDLGNPTDPLLILLVDQLLIANFAIGRLQVQSVTAALPNAAASYANCAARLLGEFRRCTLTLDALRSGTAQQQTEDDDQIDVQSPPTSANAKPPKRANGHVGNGQKKDGLTTKQGSMTRGEIPECIKNRMALPKTQNGSPLAAATG